MGACDFATVAEGIDAYQAFAEARREAVAEYGSDPYNGTISTVSGFDLIPEGAFAGMQWKTREKVFLALSRGDAHGLKGAAREAFDRLAPRFEVREKRRCIALELPRIKGMERGQRRYVFAGIAAM